MTDAVDELHERAEMFLGAEDSLNESANKIRTLEAKLRTNTALMYHHEQEKLENINRLEMTKLKIRELTEANEKLSQGMSLSHEHERKREISWRKEIERNEELQEQVEKADNELFIH